MFNSTSYYGSLGNGSLSNGSVANEYGGVFGDYSYDNGSSSQEELNWVDRIALSFGADMNTRNLITLKHTSMLSDVAPYVDELVCLPGLIFV